MRLPSPPINNKSNELYEAVDVAPQAFKIKNGEKL